MEEWYYISYDMITLIYMTHNIYVRVENNRLYLFSIFFSLLFYFLFIFILEASVRVWYDSVSHTVIGHTINHMSQ